ncbi:hypothetical protein AB6848_23955 [Serratia proteamaculans]|jgi:hypothetical protein|uniref:hypothetical protein n=1 Tax=Serratia proteamaculans TaxID=28151 RepID=UPI001F2B2232|nr:hypothetical protein [Serratia proteamaculans]MDW5509988.1 hypothetical protein [Serratia proteamaculans]
MADDLFPPVGKVNINKRTLMAGTPLYRIYPSYLKLHLCWLQAFTPVTYLSKLLGMNALAAVMQLQLFWVYKVSRNTVTASPGGNAQVG